MNDYIIDRFSWFEVYYSKVYKTRARSFFGHTQKIENIVSSNKTLDKGTTKGRIS